MKSAIERRRAPRYGLGEGAIAVLANNPGHIRNISMGGISFVFMHGEDTNQEGETVDILDGLNAFFLADLPCRVVCKKLLINEVFFSMIRMVQCSLEFGALTPAQQAELASYIDTYARAMDEGV